MAGLGFKDFQVGEVLTSANVDGYLMQQTVMRFPDAGARGSALGTAAGTGVALAEGMVSYLDDVNAVEVYDGTGWTSPVAGVGRNVVQTVMGTAVSTTSATLTDATGLSVTITPTSASSKVLVLVDIPVMGNTDDGGATYVGLSRGGTAIAAAASAEVTNGVFGQGGLRLNSGSENERITSGGSFAYLDSPASASAVTYQVRFGVTGGTGYLGRWGLSTGRTGISTITAIEVAA